MNRKTLLEIARETLKRYKDLNLDSKWLVIKDKKSDCEINFEFFIEHLEEDFDKYYRELEDYLMKD